MWILGSCKLPKEGNEEEWSSFLTINKEHGMSSLRGGLLWLTVSEVSAHVYGTAVGLWWSREHHGGRSW